MLHACLSNTAPFWCYANSIVETNPLATTIMHVSTVAIGAIAFTCCVKPMSLEVKRVFIEEMIEGNQRKSTAYSVLLGPPQNKNAKELEQPFYRLTNGDGQLIVASNPN